MAPIHHRPDRRVGPARGLELVLPVGRHGRARQEARQGRVHRDLGLRLPRRLRLLLRLIARRNQSMWPKNALTERLNLRWPILQAPMGSASTPSLAAAVTNAGGLGGLGMWGRTAEQAARRIAGFRQQSGGSLNVNYPIWPDPRCASDIIEAMQRQLQPQYDAHGLGAVPEPKGEVSDVGPDHVALLLETKPEVVSFHFGLPEPEVLRAIKSAGMFVISSATPGAEARRAEQSGVDTIIAQGTEARGHRANFN